MSKDWKVFYQTEANGYDARRYRSWYGTLFVQLYHTVLQEILDNNTDCPNPLILDVASGTGHNLETLMQHDRSVIAIDLTFAMLEESRHQRQSTIPTYILGDTFTLSFPDDTFDVVASSRFLHLFPKQRQQEAMREMIRVLKPEGMLIVDFYNHYQWQLLSPFIAVYRMFKRRRPTEDTRNTVSDVQKWMCQQGLIIQQSIGVGSYLLILARFLPNNFAYKLGHIFNHPPFRFLSEQFIISARKVS